MSLKTPHRIRKLQLALHVKAKEEPSYRFYLLYDKVYREDVLSFAYEKCRRNGGAPGVDNQTFWDIESNGRQRWLSELAKQLRSKSYRPEAVRRVEIPKPGGGKRPLGIPTIRDRVVQTAAMLVLEPIYEADFPDEQYGYRPRRSALDAIRQIHSLLNTGHREVVDADLSGYFDSIPHSELMKSIARRISDKHMLHLVKMWLKAPIEETDKRGRKQRKKPGRGIGTPQGSPISPLLSNLYMRRFILGWKTLGAEACFQGRIVNYADDFVILCKRGAEDALQCTQNMVNKLKLAINEKKTSFFKVPEEIFDFLGYTIGRCYSAQTGRSYIGTRPSKRSIARICRTISELTSRRMLLLEVEDRVKRLNQVLRGWSNYFCLGPVSKAYNAVDAHTRERLRRWLVSKHKLAGRGYSRYPDEYLYGKLGLTRLNLRTASFPWAKA